MVGIGDGLYVQPPDRSKQRLLHPASVVGVTGDIHTVMVEATGLAFEDGQDILIYYEEEREFVQQPARVVAVVEPETNPVLEFKTTGDPVSAERRQFYRVSTVMSGLTAKLGSEDVCPLLDVSASGFSVIAANTYHVGDIIEAALEFEDRRYTGEVCVLNVRTLSDGRTRYGLHCIVGRRSSSSIQAGSHDMTMEIQRQQLRRLSRAT